jgi:hypothetical protein
VEGDRKIIEVEDRDTTYRVQSKRISDLKARALAAYFPPEKVRYKPQAVKNGKAMALAYIDARAVMDRLDYVLGAENWQTSYKEVGKDSVECTLAVRFIDGGEWITKVDVGSTSEQPDEGDRMKAAYSDALKRAAVQFGVGRYLYSFPRLWVDYDEQKRRFTNPPAIPANFLPSGHLPAGPDKMSKVSGLLTACLSAAKIAKDQWRTATTNLFADYGYKGDPREEHARVEGRHADAMLQRLNQWAGEIAKGNANCPSSPLYNPNPAPATARSETKAAQQTVVA